MSKLNKYLAVLALIVAVVTAIAVFWPQSETSETLSATGDMPIENYVPAIMYNDGYYSQKSIETTQDVIVGDDATVSGGTLTVTTANTATSTVVVGCIQTYATSTATPWKSYASSTATIEGVDGVMLLSYGTCPGL